MDTSKESVASNEHMANKDGEEKLLLEGHASSQHKSLDFTDPPPTSIDLSSFEMTVQTSKQPSEYKTKSSPLTSIVQQETPPRSMLTPMPNRSFSCLIDILHPIHLVLFHLLYLPSHIPPHNQLGNSSNYGFGYSSSGADVISIV